MFCISLKVTEFKSVQGFTLINERQLTLIHFVSFPIILLACVAAACLRFTSFAQEHGILSTNAKSFRFANLAMVQNCAFFVITNANSLTGTTITQAAGVVNLFLAS